jgi:hypothetical protein
MNPEDLLRAPRNIHLLVRKPNSADDLSWSMCLHGLHQAHIKDAVTTLRQDRQRHGESISQSFLKPKALHDAIASAYGMKSYDDWLTRGQHSLISFLHDNGLSRPTDLITWREGRPGLGETLTAQRIADRLFNSGLPLPRRIFTGSGSLMFAAHGYGNIDLSDLMARDETGLFGSYCLSTALDYCERHAQEVVFRATRLHMWEKQVPDYLDLTGHQMLLNTFGFEAGSLFNLLGCNLLDPPIGEPVFRLYNASPDEIATYQRLYSVFRSEMERSPRGWVEVIPLPGNENIIFLKGDNGEFDWVVRDQRDAPHSDNPYYPFLQKADLPSAIRDAEALKSHLYYSRGDWYEKLEHEAEDRHYKEGGSAANWPGYTKLIQRELVATRGYAPVRQRQGGQSPSFTPHRIQDYCLMISPLVTIEEFWRFYTTSRWKDLRSSRIKASRSEMDTDLSPLNLFDPDHLPASVMWLDAVAYCKAYEEETGLPVRLLSIEEWRQTFGSLATANEKKVTDLPSAVAGKWPEPLQYVRDAAWRINEHGLKALYARDFGEWLSDYQSGNAPAVCAATGKSLTLGPLERDILPVDCTMRYKGMKVGFRMCYASRLDA